MSSGGGTARVHQEGITLPSMHMCMECAWSGGVGLAIVKKLQHITLQVYGHKNAY